MKAKMLWLLQLTLVAMVACSPTILGCPTPCTCSGTTVDCGLKGLTSIPAGIPVNTQNLWLNHNLFTTITVGIFDKLTQLQVLFLSGNQLTSIPVGIFDKLTQLGRLYLNNNQLTSIFVGAFDKVTQLQFLGLSTNKLTLIPVGTFDKLTQLQFLSLNNNQLTSIPVGIFDKLTQLQTLWLYTNRFTSIPVGAFDKLTQLQTLDLLPNPLILDQSLCGLQTVADRQPTALNGVLKIKTAFNQARDNVNCTSSTKLCYAAKHQSQHFFCECSQGQYYNGLECSNNTKSLLTGDNDGNPVCYSTNSKNYICQCPFGQSLSPLGCENSNLTVKSVTATSAAISWNSFTYGYNGSVFLHPSHKIHFQSLDMSHNETFFIPPGQESFIHQNLCSNTSYIVSIINSDFYVRSFTTPFMAGACQLRENFFVQHINSTALHLSWTSWDTKYNITGYTLQEEFSSGVVTGSVSPNTNTTVISGLQPYTVYFFGLLAGTSLGTGPLARVVSIRTNQSVPSSSPVVTVVQVVSKSEIHVTWIPLPQREVNGALLGYYINIRDSDVTFNKTTANNSNFVITGLQPFTVYWISVSAFTKIGTGPFSNETQARTNESVPSSSPVVTVVHVVSKSEIHVTWIPLPQREVNGALLGYHINIRDSDVTFNKTTANNSNSVITGLQPFTFYWISVSAFTKVGTGPFSNETQVRTNESVPSSSPVVTVVHVVSKSEIQVTWVPLPQREVNGALLGYYINIRDDDVTFNKTTANNSNIVITGLQPFTVYWISVSAFTKIGTGPFSNETQTRTNESVPSSAPILTAVHGVGKSQIDVSWKPLRQNDVNGVLQGYKIKVGDVEVEFNLTSPTSASITGLKPNTLYKVAVSAFTKVGTGPYSNYTQTRTQFQDQFCAAVSTNDERGNFTWRRTLSNTTAVAPCSLTLNYSLTAVATRHCGIPGTRDLTWSSPDTTSCPFLSATTRQLQSLADQTQLVNLTEETTLSTVIQTANLTTNAIQLTASDVNFTASILENVVKSGIINIVNTTTAQQVSGEIVVIVDNILNVPKVSVKQESASRISLAVENFFKTVPLAPNETYRQGEDNIGVVVNCPDTQTDESVQANLENGILTVDISGPTYWTNNTQLAEINIPSTAIQRAANTSSYSESSCPSARTSYVYYHVTSLFQDPHLQDQNQELASGVMLGQVGSSSLTNLADPVLLTFNITRKPNTRKVSGYNCAFWNYSLGNGVGGWSTDGCTLVKPVTEDIAECQCNHLTNFACIVSYYPVSTKQALSVVTYIGCGLSLLGLLVTVISCLAVKNLRQSNHQRLMIGLCLTLILLLIFFLLGMERNVLYLSDRACYAMAIIQHYLLLCTFAWTSAVATLLHSRLVIVFSNFSKSGLRKLVTATLVLPFIIVAITAGSTQAKVYTTDQFCWLNNLYAFIGAVYVPLAISLAYNITILVLIIRSLKNRREVSRSSPSQGGSNVLKLARTTIIISFLLGLTWSLSAFVIFLDHVALEYIFAFLNTSQGLFIFLLHTVRSPEVRAGWSKTITILTRISRHYSTDKQSSKPSKALSGNTRKQQQPEPVVWQNMPASSFGLSDTDLCST